MRLTRFIWLYIFLVIFFFKCNVLTVFFKLKCRELSREHRGTAGLSVSVVKNVKLRNIFYPAHSNETSQANYSLGVDLHTCSWFGNFGDAELLNVKLKCRELNREYRGVAGLSIPAVKNVKLRSYLACGNWISQVNYSLSVEPYTFLWLGSSGDADIT